MSSAVTPDLLASVAQPTGLLQTLLTISLTAVAVLRPLFAEDGEIIQDFAWVHLNPAGQQMLQQPACPTASLLTLFPTAQTDGVFAQCCEAFATGELRRNQTYYRADGLDGYFLLVAQRYEDLLVVNFTDMVDQDRTPVEEALRESQTRAEVAHLAAERQRQEVTALFQQAPASIAQLTGPTHVFTLVNPGYQQLVGNRPLLGLPLATAFPELVGPYLVLLDQVYQTGKPYYGHEVPADYDRTNSGRLERAYFNFICQATRDALGQVTGVLIFAYDVSEQVLAHQQVDRLNEELAASNEELRATNDEFLASNVALGQTQQQLQQLNQELEARVQARTQELAQQGDRLERLLQEAPAAICMLNGPDLVFELVNPGYQQLFPDRDLLHQSVFEALPEIVGGPVEAMLHGVYETGVTFTGNEVLMSFARPGDGQLVDRYFNFIYQARYDGSGQVDGLVVFAFEVTESVHTRQHAAALQATLLADTQRQAQEREEFYQVFEQVPVVVALLRGPAHFFHYRNPAFQGLFPGRTLTGHLYADVMPEIVAAGLMPELDRVYATGETYIGNAVPFVTTSPEGGLPHQRYYDFSYHPHREAGQITGVSIFAYDVTEQMHARQQVQALNEELAAINQEVQAINEELLDANTRLLRANTDLDTFVYAASHDLKAPIANIEGLLNALREYLPTHEQEPMVPRLVGMMEGAIARFQQTVGHLTDVSHLQQGQYSQPIEYLDIPQALEDVRLDLLPLLESSRAELVVAVATCSNVRFSAKHLRSVLFNLLSNAVKYRAPDRLPVVQVRTACTPTQLNLAVQDNGLGLSEYQQDQLFTMFRRLHTHVEGSGVGLYLIKRAVENAGGTLTVESQLGVGSTFTVTLPRA